MRPERGMRAGWREAKRLPLYLSLSQSINQIPAPAKLSDPFPTAPPPPPITTPKDLVGYLRAHLHRRNFIWANTYATVVDEI